MENFVLTPKSSRLIAAFVVITLLLLLLSFSQSSQQLSLEDKSHVWFIHLVLELLSIFVSISLVAVLFQRLDDHENQLANIIIFGFTAVALLDFVHAMSYAGMPILVTESSVEKAIFFWLMARFFELFTLSAIAIRLTVKGAKITWLGLAVVTVLVISYFGLFHLNLFPVTFVPGQGVTAFKANAEYLLFLGNSGLTAYFIWKFWQHRHRQTLLFAGSAYCMAICSLSLTSYASPSDFNLFLGHLLKILSAVCLYLAIFWTELKKPYLLVQTAEAKTKEKDQQLEAILGNIPLGIMRIDNQGICRYSNPYLQSLSEFSSLQSNASPCHLQQILPQNVYEVFTPLFDQSSTANSTKLAFNYRCGEPHKFVSREVIAVPETIGQAHYWLCLVVDTTAREQAAQNEAQALHETQMLRQALDEHAIVVFTDAKGIITSVNDKFCEISQYSREELMGQSHRLINSGFHGHDFFRDMWKTIARGQVWHGEVCNKAKDGSLYWVNTTIVPFLNEQNKPSQYIAIRADITERKLAEREAQRLAYYDDLTSLPNRRLFVEKLEKLFQEPEQQKHSTHALLLLDLDDFKEINDTLGHAAGDEVLKQIARRIQHLTESTQFAARLGGDEFVVLYVGDSSSKEQVSIAANTLAEQIRLALRAPYYINDLHISSSVSIGMTLINSFDDLPSECLKQADVALYQAKSQGKNQVSFFEPELQIALNRRNLIQLELKEAIAKNELELHYQPIYNSQKVIVGAEALVRWRSNKLGMVSPAEFIPVAEQSQLIVEIGQWVLRTGCAQLAEWAQHPVRQHWSLAVNVSARQLQQRDFITSVQDAIYVERINPTHLKLEITESMLQNNVEQTISKMAQLKSLGILFSLDDFGTGYSSLSYLTKLPIDTLKIDKSFVDKMIDSREDAAVVNTILSLASTLALDVVAEGVETQAQFEFLAKAGCPSFQGYLLSKPLPSAQIALLETTIC